MIVSTSGEWTPEQALDRIRLHAELNVYSGGDDTACLRLITDLLHAAREAVVFSKKG